jgi:hypothetical protein
MENLLPRHSPRQFLAVRGLLELARGRLGLLIHLRRFSRSSIAG